MVVPERTYDADNDVFNSDLAAVLVHGVVQA